MPYQLDTNLSTLYFNILWDSVHCQGKSSAWHSGKIEITDDCMQFFSELSLLQAGIDKVSVGQFFLKLQ